MQAKTFDVQIELLSDMLGTVPKDKEVFKTFVESKKPSTEDEDESLTVEQIEEKGWTGFHVDAEKGLFIYNYMIKGFIKNAANVFKDDPEIKVKAFRSKIDDLLFIAPRKIFLGMKESVNYLERPIRVMTMQGPRVALIRSDICPAGTALGFQIRIFIQEKFKVEHIRRLFAYGEDLGLGQWRNGGYGQFKTLRFEEVMA